MSNDIQTVANAVLMIADHMDGQVDLVISPHNIDKAINQIDRYDNPGRNFTVPGDGILTSEGVSFAATLESQNPETNHGLRFQKENSGTCGNYDHPADSGLLNLSVDFEGQNSWLQVPEAEVRQAIEASRYIFRDPKPTPLPDEITQTTRA